MTQSNISCADTVSLIIISEAIYKIGEHKYIAKNKQERNENKTMNQNATTNKKLNKWQRLSEFMDIINKDPLLLGIDARMITRASTIGERMWILKYKEIYVSLFDLGNGYWEYFSLLSLPATIYSVVYEKIDFFLFKLTHYKRKETTKL